MNALTGIAATDAGTGNTTTPQPRLVRAAHEFEAQMMQEMMKPLTQGSSLTGEDTDSGNDSGSAGALGQFATEALGRALSERGGFGIANSVLKDLSHSGNKSVSEPGTGSLPTKY
jgi:Rod binding domain-containing protein